MPRHARPHTAAHIILLAAHLVRPGAKALQLGKILARPCPHPNDPHSYTLDIHIFCVAPGAREPLTRIMGCVLGESLAPASARIPQAADTAHRPFIPLLNNTACPNGAQRHPGPPNQCHGAHQLFLYRQLPLSGVPSMRLVFNPASRHPASAQAQPGPRAPCCLGTHIASARGPCNTRHSALLGAIRREPSCLPCHPRGSRFVTPHCRTRPMHGENMYVTPRSLLLHLEHGMDSSRNIFAAIN